MMKLEYWVYADRKHPKQNESATKLCGIYTIGSRATRRARDFTEDPDYKNIRIHVQPAIGTQAYRDMIKERDNEQSQ